MSLIRTRFTPKEQRIAKAIKALDSGECKSVADANRTYNVPYNKLRYRYQGRPCNNTNGGLNRALNRVQEQALLLYIDQCDELGRPCKHIHIELGANSILRALNSPKTVSQAWTSRFIKRYKVFKHCTKPLSIITLIKVAFKLDV
jgi:hypothetical protein